MLKFIKRVIKFISHRSGATQWPTKSFKIWLLIQNILNEFQPNKLIEFGSGRSTSFLAEFSEKENKKFLSIEQNLAFSKMVKKGLEIANLKADVVKHIAIKYDWYDINKLKKISLSSYDFILIDGPGGAFNKGDRNSKNGIDFIKSICNEGTILIFDDTQRDDVCSVMDNFRKELFPKSKIYTFQYDVGNKEENSISFLIPQLYDVRFNKLKKTVFL